MPDMVYLGLSGEASDDLRAAVPVMERGFGAGEDEVAVLRKTRAGGNWLIGGMVVIGLVVLVWMGEWMDIWVGVCVLVDMAGMISWR